MFPFDIEDDDLVDIAEETEEVEPADYEIDFDTGTLTGRVATGLDSIIQWVKIVLNTDRYTFMQYSWNHGNELNELMGKNYSTEYLETEIDRIVTEALSQNEDILDISELDFSRKNDAMHVSFHLETSYGEADIYV